MNDDAVNVRRIDFLSAFPTLKIFATFTLALHPISLGFSILTVASLLSIEVVFGRPGSGAYGDAVQRLWEDLHLLAIRGFDASMSSWLGVALRLGFLTFAGVAISKTVATSMCQQPTHGSSRGSVTQSVWMAGLTVWGLVCFLLIVGFTGLRFGQLITNWFAGSSRAGWVSSLPSIFSGVVFLLLSILVLAAWGLSATSIMIEKSDGSEAFSRSLSYCLSRPVRVVFLLATSYLFSRLIQSLIVFLVSAAAALQNSRPLQSAARIDDSTTEFVSGLLGQSFGLSSLLTSVSISYLLVRLAEDGVSLAHRQ